jgi:RimJ/RimL family protein N-acetyltransferase
MPENVLGQPIGWPVKDWAPRPRPPRTAMEGQLCRLEPLDPARHAEALHAANEADRDGRGWTYMAYGPFASLADYRAWADGAAKGEDPLFFTVLDRGEPVGVASFLRIDPAPGVIEVGHIKFAPALQRRPAATEAMFLMMRRVFDELGYRRYEWKCDALNLPSRSAAHRLGFTYEGIFRQATLYKGRNRDTAWFAMTDHEWPYLKAAFERWLAPANFDETGRQKSSLSDLTRSAIAKARLAE